MCVCVEVLCTTESLLITFHFKCYKNITYNKLNLSSAKIHVHKHFLFSPLFMVIFNLFLHILYMQCYFLLLGAYPGEAGGREGFEQCHRYFTIPATSQPPPNIKKCCDHLLQHWTQSPGEGHGVPATGSGLLLMRLHR